MNEQDKQISSLAIKSLSERVAKEATQSATLEALYTVTAMELEQMKQIIESDEKLKAKFEEVKGRMTNAIVKAQAEIEQAVQSLAKAKTDLSANKVNIDSVSAITEVLIALAIGQNGGMPTNTYNKVAQFIKPLVKDRRYVNGDIVSMPYPYDTNPKWPKETQTILKFQMQESEGYTYKEQPLAEMLQKGILTIVMPRIE